MSDHLSRDELTMWRDAGAGDRARIVSHLAACAACRRTAASVEEDRPADGGPPRFDAADFLARGYRAGAQPPASRWGGRQVWIAGAAAVVILALIPTWRARFDDRSAVERGGPAALVVVRPVDTVVSADELTFEWKGTAAGDRVRLNVVDLGNPGEPLIEHEVAGSRYDPTPEERRRFRPGHTVHWYIEVRNRASAGPSPAASFRVR
jgi:hypothetical protein